MIWSIDPHIRAWLPRLQAHRGLWVQNLRENSLEAVQAAQAAGYEMCEFDVRMTLDGEVVLFHDDRYKKTVLAKTTLADFHALTPVSGLEEVLVWLKSVPEFKLNIEIKSRKLLQYRLEKKVCELVAKHKLEKRILISSFNPISLYKVRRYNPLIYRALLLSMKNESGNNFVVKSAVMNYLCRPHMLNLRFEDYRGRFRRLAKKIPVVLWTVNDISVFRRHEKEIHGIISDTILPTEFTEIKT